MLDLSGLTTFVNLVALAASLWLGFYIVTRSSHSDLSRLAAIMLWCLSGFFLYNALAINLPGVGVLAWLRQTIIVVLPLWLQVTVMLLPDATRAAPRVFIGLALAYGVALVLFITGILGAGLVSDASGISAVYTSARAAGPLFAVFFVYLVLIYSFSLLNLKYGRDRAYDPVMKRQFSTLLLATALSGLGGLYLSAGIQFDLDWPTLPGDAALGTGVLLLGYAVARFRALLEGRRLERDFLYALIAVGSLTTLYVFVVWIFYVGGHISFLTLILTIVGVISFNSLYDGVRVTLDRLFYHSQFQQLRSNLRALAREAGTGRTLTSQLQSILASLCRALGIQKGLIALKSGEGYATVAAQNADSRDKIFPGSALKTSEIIGLFRPAERDLEGMAVLVPLFAGESQIGALVLGEREDGRAYSEQNLELLDDLADQIAGVVHSLQTQEENAKRLNTLVTDFRARERELELQVQGMLAERKEERKPVLEDIGEEDLVRLVEECMRRLYDFPYLGEQRLARLHIVEARLLRGDGASITSLDRGKAVNAVLLAALQKLRPSGTEPDKYQVPSREWHSFIVLNDSYVNGQFNREIMARLYIGEGTFNRTRRRALRAVAKALLEMEQDACQAAEAASSRSLS